jgi:hypothetical protein
MAQKDYEVKDKAETRTVATTTLTEGEAVWQQQN